VSQKQLWNSIPVRDSETFRQPDPRPRRNDGESLKLEFHGADTDTATDTDIRDVPIV